MSDDHRLIEDFLPIQAISAEASREKSVRKGHISTLHLWWARRPLVACRAAVYGAFVPASRFIPENGPDNKKQSLGRANAAKFVERLCKYPGNPTVIKDAQKHILEAHTERLTRETGKKVTVEDIEEGRAPRPKVLDMFAGGGAIPLEALRLGCEAYALDLNPVAHIIELCTLVYPQKYGKLDPNTRGMTGPKNDKGKTTWSGLAEEVRYWGNWVLEKIQAEIGDLYPLIPDPKSEKNGRYVQAMFPDSEREEVPQGYLVPVAYLWTRTVRCKNPSCSATVPLVKQTWLCKKKGGKKSPGRYIALKVIAPKGEKKVRFEVVEAMTEKGLGFDPAGFSKAGNATCPFCGSVTDNDYVKMEGCSGRLSQQPMAIVALKPGQKGKVYLSHEDYPQAFYSEDRTHARIADLCSKTSLTLPDEQIITDAKNSCWTYLYGQTKFSDLFASRQLLFLLTFVQVVRKSYKVLQNSGFTPDHARAIVSYLGLLVSTISNSNSAVCRWIPQNQQMGSTFSRNGIPMAWDYAEINPLGGASGDSEKYLQRLIEGIEAALCGDISARIARGTATQLPWETECIDAVITDPPYYDNIPYADLSDFFYVWLKRCIGDVYPEHFATTGTPKKKEVVADATRVGGNRVAANHAYERMMRESLKEIHRVLKAAGQITVVYAHKTTLGWATLVEAFRQAGFTVTEAWPLDTEKPGRMRAIDSAALASSIFLVARKREGAETGSYEEVVQPELEKIVRERVDTLWKMGITGADLVIAAVGAGLRAFTRFARVEYANGEEVPAEKFLAEVEGVVLETLMEKIFGMAGSGVAAVDGPSRFYVLWRYTYKAAEMDAGEAIVFTYGQNVELDGQKGLSSGSRALVEKKKGKYRLYDFAERGDDEKLGMSGDDSTPAPLIDVLHRILWLIENEPRNLNRFLDEARPDRERLRLVAQTLAGTALAGKKDNGTEHLVATTASEQAALKKLVANWRALIDQRLAASEGALFDFGRK